MVYGIDHDRWDCDKLFNLMCLFGNVNKVSSYVGVFFSLMRKPGYVLFQIKYMKSKTDTAMVEMGDPGQMQTAINYLHNAPIFGTKLALR